MEDQLFALMLPGKDPVYVQVCRDIGGEKTIQLFYDSGSLDNVRRLLDTDMFSMADEEEAMHLSAGIEGACIIYTNKNKLEADEAKEISDMAKRFGVQLKGGGACPAFLRMHCGRPREMMTDAGDEEVMGYALDALSWFIKDKDDSMRLFIPASVKHEYNMTALKTAGKGFEQTSLSIPALGKMKYPAGTNCNEILQKRLKKMKKKGSWVCRIIRLSRPAVWGDGGETVLPSVIKTINYDKRDYIAMIPVAYYEKRTDVMLDKFMEAVIAYGSCPISITVMDERTYTLLKQWCKNCGIKLERTDYIPEFDLPDEIFEEGFDEEELLKNELAFLEAALDFVGEIPASELGSFADEIRSIREMKDPENYMILPLKLQRKLDKLLKKLDKEKDKKD